MSKTFEIITLILSANIYPIPICIFAVLKAFESSINCYGSNMLPSFWSHSLLNESVHSEPLCIVYVRYRKSMMPVTTQVYHYTLVHRRRKNGGSSPNSLPPISYFGRIWELYVLDLKTNIFCRKKIQLHFPMSKGLTMPK